MRMVYSRPILGEKQTFLPRQFQFSPDSISTRLRQRLTDGHLSELMLISQECPEVLNKDSLHEIAYIWFKQSPVATQNPAAKGIG